MNGIYSLGHNFTHYCSMDSIIKTLRFMLNVLLNVGMASSNLLPIGSGEHNIAMLGKGVGFYSDRAGGCHSQYLGMAELKQDKYDSHHTFSSPTAILSSGN